MLTYQTQNVLASALIVALGLSTARAADVTPAEARAIAKDAFVYAYGPIQGYQTLYSQTQDAASPGYIGGFGRFRHYARVATPADKDIVAPNNDTPYSWAWLDLRREPVVLKVPALPKERYNVFQWFDLYTHNFAYVGVRATGFDAGTYLFAGPNWKGDAPPGVTKVFRAETDIIGTLTRTSISGESDVPNVRALQQQYVLMPLSEFAAQKPPPPAPDVSFPRWMRRRRCLRSSSATSTFSCSSASRAIRASRRCWRASRRSASVRASPSSRRSWTRPCWPRSSRARKTG